VIAATSAAVVVLAALSSGGSACLNGRGRPAPTEIFQGITYGCERLNPSEEGSGFIHWVRIDLTAPGIELYVTPLDRSALAAGWQYRLRTTASVVRREHLAVTINATLFASKFDWLLRIPGDVAKGEETVVADHVVSHVGRDTYLLWFDDQLAPHVQFSKPPMPAELAQAKWGIGGQAVGLRDGKLSPFNGRVPDARTAVAIDRQQKLLFLAVGEYVSPRRLLQKLGELGAQDGMLLDGGGSSSMAVGQGARGISPGILYGGWRPVATHFGVRAQPIAAEK